MTAYVLVVMCARSRVVIGRLRSICKICPTESEPDFVRESQRLGYLLDG